MDEQKEALRRIISSLSNKNQELQNHLQNLDWTLSGLQEESCRVMSDLEAELEKLSAALEERGAELRAAINQSQRNKEAELQMQREEGQEALASCEELLDFANRSLTITDHEEFTQAAKQIKERVTMAPAFRISSRIRTSPNMSQFSVDFNAEREGLTTLHFLPVPEAPDLDASRCFVKDNSIFVQWSPVDQSGASYELQYRKCDSAPRPAPEPWTSRSDLREAHATISGLRFDSQFVEVRVRAKNKAATGDFSETLVLETPAFHFCFDALTAHAELKVEDHAVTWDPQTKSHDSRVRTKTRSATPSPNKSAAGRASRERFAGDSYTVLGDQEICGGGHYWELRPMGDWKSLSVGVAYRGALSRFVQLGKSPASWSLSLSQWLQSSVSAKHNNRNKQLDCPLPRRIGVYCHHGNGDLLFIDVDRLKLVHWFRAKFNQPLVPAFTVWCGGLQVDTGLQVPSFIDQFLPTDRSLTNLSQ